jgi:hypothetical protein
MTHVDITRRLMMQAAPPGAKVISDQVMDRLRGLTADLLAHQPDQDDPLPRYLAIQDRSIPFGEADVAVALRDRRVVFTGGSGCIGTELLRQLWVNGVTDLISLANTAPTCSVLGVRGNGS